MGCACPDSSRYVAFNGAEYLVPSLNIFPISITRSMRSSPSQSGTALAVTHLAQIRELGRVVAPGLDAQQVVPGAVGTGHVLALAQRLVGDHPRAHADRPDRARLGAKGGNDLLRRGRPILAAQRLGQPSARACDRHRAPASARPRRPWTAPSPWRWPPRRSRAGRPAPRSWSYAGVSISLGAVQALRELRRCAAASGPAPRWPRSRSSSTARPRPRRRCSAP